MMDATAFAPCHITGMFQIFDVSADPLQIGSTGAGVSIDRGVTTNVWIKRAARMSVKITVNKGSLNASPVSKQVTDLFLSKLKRGQRYEIVVNHTIGVPVGFGFGTSGAAALSLALALNQALGLYLSNVESAQLAHVAEVKCRTGLGTVIAETYGGAELRTKPGAPGIGELKPIPTKDDAVVACLTFASLSTPQNLADPVIRERINRIGETSIKELSQKPSVTRFMRLSRQFAEYVGLITGRMRPVLDACDKAGACCSMPMFGESVFTLTDVRHLGGVKRIFSRFSSEDHIIVSGIDHQGARLI